MSGIPHRLIDDAADIVTCLPSFATDQATVEICPRTSDGLNTFGLVPSCLRWLIRSSRVVMELEQYVAKAG